MHLISGHTEAGVRYAHHMGSCEHVPAVGWAQFADRPETRLALSGYDFPGMDGAALEAKCKAILLNRRVGKFSRRAKS